MEEEPTIRLQSRSYETVDERIVAFIDILSRHALNPIDDDPVIPPTAMALRNQMLNERLLYNRIRKELSRNKYSDIGQINYLTNKVPRMLWYHAGPDFPKLPGSDLLDPKYLLADTWDEIAARAGDDPDEFNLEINTSVPNRAAGLLMVCASQQKLFGGRLTALDSGCGLNTTLAMLDEHQKAPQRRAAGEEVFVIKSPDVWYQGTFHPELTQLFHELFEREVVLDLGVGVDLYDYMNNGRIQRWSKACIRAIDRLNDRFVALHERVSAPNAPGRVRRPNITLIGQMMIQELEYEDLDELGLPRRYKAVNASTVKYMHPEKTRHEMVESERKFASHAHVEHEPAHLKEDRDDLHYDPRGAEAEFNTFVSFRTPSGFSKRAHVATWDGGRCRSMNLGPHIDELDIWPEVVEAISEGAGRAVSEDEVKNTLEKAERVRQVRLLAV